jgi:L-seryl-tRNA(Ser) seleniumtransferase
MTSILASLPSVNEVLQDPAFVAASAGLADVYRTRLVRQVIDAHRQELRDGKSTGARPERVAAAVVTACVRELEALDRVFPRRVVNGTGVLIHTNLGRAPLGALLEELDTRSLAGYSDLEWDSASQARGNRDLALQRQLRLLTGAEAALVVNNCASAIYLALGTLAAGKEVLVSRAELVEIGGSFRVPDIMEASGCQLREVGTTNKTRLTDYERYAREGTSVLLKVHQSNFVQRGFVEQTAIEELVALGRRLGIPVIEDNGSGLLVAGGEVVLADEPRVTESLDKGVDVLCCSGDKLLGGIQAGILLGKAKHIGAMRRNPLFRVLRLDKVRMALLSRALQLYLAGRATEVPLWRAFHTTVDELARRAGQLRLPSEATRWASSRLVPVRSTLGGGSNPEADFESLGLELVHRDLPADEVKRRFAARSIPIVGYVQRDRYYLDMRTIFAHDLPELQQALDELGGNAHPGTPHPRHADRDGEGALASR